MIYIPATQFKTIGPEKKKYSMGITAMQALVNGDVLIGTGEGKIHMTEKETFKPLKYYFEKNLLIKFHFFLLI
jgi:hypothetical protein